MEPWGTLSLNRDYIHRFRIAEPVNQEHKLLVLPGHDCTQFFVVNLVGWNNKIYIHFLADWQLKKNLFLIFSLTNTMGNTMYYINRQSFFSYTEFASNREQQ